MSKESEDACIVFYANYLCINLLGLIDSMRQKTILGVEIQYIQFCSFGQSYFSILVNLCTFSDMDCVTGNHFSRVKLKLDTLSFLAHIVHNHIQRSSCAVSGFHSVVGICLMGYITGKKVISLQKFTRCVYVTFRLAAETNYDPRQSWCNLRTI